MVIAVTLFAVSAVTADICSVTLSSTVALIDRRGSDLIGKIYHHDAANNLFVMTISWLVAMVYLIKVRVHFWRTLPPVAQAAMAVEGIE